MMRVWIRSLAIAFVASCLEPGAVSCRDGRTCPSGRVCDDVHALCVTRSQSEVCRDVADGASCVAVDFDGICHGGVCVSGCGNNVVDRDWLHDREEECDDGNSRSRDGCSSTCRSETPSWTELGSPWVPRLGAAVVYDDERDVIVMFGGVANGGRDNTVWERDAQRRWNRRDVTVAPSPRSDAMIAYDAARDVVVLFGGGCGVPVRGGSSPRSELGQADASKRRSRTRATASS